MKQLAIVFRLLHIAHGYVLAGGHTERAGDVVSVFSNDAHQAVAYLIFGNKRAYLSTILDLYDRKIVAYQISKRNDIKLVIDTLNQAIAKTKDVSNLIIHSDQGFQYTSSEYKAVCESNGIQISMSRKGTPIDDSPIESFHSILKKETLYNNYITSFDEYLLLVEDGLNFYNTSRLKNRKR